MAFYEFCHYESGDRVVREFRIGEAPKTVQEGSRTYERVWSASFIVPPYMKAPGSVGSSYMACERQAEYLKSDRHRKDMQKHERMIQREEAIQGKKDSLIRDVSKKVEEVRRAG